MNVGAVAGGIVGGVVLATVATIILCRRMRHKTDHDDRLNLRSLDPNPFSDNNATGVVEPYTLSSRASERPSKWQEFYMPHQDGTRSSAQIRQAQTESTLVPGSDISRERMLWAGSTSSGAGDRARDVIGQPNPGDLDELPSLIGRLYNLLGRQQELPPAYTR